MRWSGMVGLGRIVVVVAALALVTCYLSSPPGLTPAQAGFFSKAKDGDKDKDKGKGGSSATSETNNKKDPGGGPFIGNKGKGGSSSATSESNSNSKNNSSGGFFFGGKGKGGSSAETSENNNKNNSSGGFFFGGKGKPGSTGGSSAPGGSVSTPGTPGSRGGIYYGGNQGNGGIFTRTTRNDGGDNRSTPVPVPRDGGGFFGRGSGTREAPVWQPRTSPGGYYGGGRSSGGIHSGQGYFTEIQRLKGSSHYRYDGRFHRTVDWWWWWYPYDLRYYQYHYGYYDPFAPNYPFLFVYVGAPGAVVYYPYYVYQPPRPAVIVIAGSADREDDNYYPYLSQQEGSLGEAVREIESAWRNEDLDRLMRHVDSEQEIRVYYGNTFSHSMTAREFSDLTRDAFDTTRTVSLRFSEVERLSDDWAKAKGRHVFYDPNGDRREVYVYYLLEGVRDGRYRDWLVREIGQGPQPY